MVDARGSGVLAALKASPFYRSLNVRFSKSQRLLASLVLPVALALPGFSLYAADGNGDFALEGAGRASCERFVKAMASDSTEVLLFGGWLHGYLTGVNQYAPDTYDIATWPSQKQQLAYLRNFCQQHPERSFFQAAAAMALQMAPERLRNKETPISVGGRLELYPSTILQIQERLQEQGFGMFTGTTPNSWDGAIESAVAEYQRSQGLPVTGEPDEETLLRLLR